MLNNNQILNLEMQVKNEHNWAERSLVYLCRSFDQLYRGQEYEEAPFTLLSLEEYTDLVADSIRILPEKMVIHRMTGDGPGYLLIAPQWVRNKKKVLNTIHRKL